MALVCLCRRVNEQAVELAITSGAFSVDEVAAVCGAGARCGGCRPTVESMLACPVLNAKRQTQPTPIGVAFHEGVSFPERAAS